VTSAIAGPPENLPSHRGGEASAPTALDDDDGIHIASVTRAGPPGDPVLRVVVSWWEEGAWVEKAVDLAGTPPGEVDVPIRDTAASGPGLSDRPGPDGPDIDELLLRLGVREAAERLGVSERTLRRRYARLGSRLHDHLGKLRRERALDLLGGGLPVSVIALRLGFASSQTFARWVRRSFGFTATELRRGLRMERAGKAAWAAGGAPR